MKFALFSILLVSMNAQAFFGKKYETNTCLEDVRSGRIIKLGSKDRSTYYVNFYSKKEDWYIRTVESPSDTIDENTQLVKVICPR